MADGKSTCVIISVAFVEYSTVSPPSAAFEIRPVITLDSNIDANLRLTAFSDNANLVKWTYTGTKITNVDIFYDLAGAGTFLTRIGVGSVAAAAGGAGVNWDAIPDINGIL